MPNRILKESIITSENLVGLSAEAEVLFYRLIVKVDDFGLFHANPRIISSLLYPLSVPSEKKVSGWLEELVNAGVVSVYEVDGKQYLQLITFAKHQKPRANKSKYPTPPQNDTFKQTQTNVCKCSQMSADDCACKQMSPINENENDNVNDNENDIVNDKYAQSASGFDEFWTQYPRKVSKKDALKAWMKLKPKESTVQKILSGLAEWKQTEQWKKDGGSFIPYPSTFLRQERWKECDVGKAPHGFRDYSGNEDF